MSSLGIHYNDVIMGAMASQVPASRLFTQPFILAQMKENIKVPCEFPAQMASNAEMCSCDGVIMIVRRLTPSMHVQQLSA